MNYVRTFFEKPLLDIFGDSVVMLDLTCIHAITKDNEAMSLFLSGRRNPIKLEGESEARFWAVFEEYARDMQSLERGPVRLPGITKPDLGTPWPAATEKSGETPPK